MFIIEELKIFINFVLGVFFIEDMIDDNNGLIRWIIVFLGFECIYV